MTFRDVQSLVFGKRNPPMAPSCTTVMFSILNNAAGQSGEAGSGGGGAGGGDQGGGSRSASAVSTESDQEQERDPETWTARQSDGPVTGSHSGKLEPSHRFPLLPAEWPAL